MNGLNKRTSEKLGRVLVFADNHPELFEKNSLAGQLKDELAATTADFNTLHRSQAAVLEDGRVLTVDRSGYRDDLFFRLEALAATAESLGLKQFWAPRNRTDHALLQMAQTFVERAEASLDTLSKGGLGPEFISELKTAIQNLEGSIKTQASTKDMKRKSTSGVGKARGAALSLLSRLDPVLENLLRKDEPTLAAWRSARHTERSRKPHRRKSPAESQATAAESTSDSHAA